MATTEENELKIAGEKLIAEMVGAVKVLPMDTKFGIKALDALSYTGDGNDGVDTVKTEDAFASLAAALRVSRATAAELHKRLPGYTMDAAGNVTHAEDASAIEASKAFGAKWARTMRDGDHHAVVDALADLLRCFRGPRYDKTDATYETASRLLKEYAFPSYRQAQLVTNLLKDLEDTRSQLAHQTRLAKRWEAFILNIVLPNARDAQGHYLSPEDEATVSTLVGYSETLEVECEHTLSKGPPPTPQEVADTQAAPAVAALSESR